MKIKVTKFTNDLLPQYALDMDAGADISIPVEVEIRKGINKIPLGFAVELPNGCFGLILPKSGNKMPYSLQPVPIDPSYTGELHAIMLAHEDYVIPAKKKIGQLVIMPFVRADFVENTLVKRGNRGFGSTGEFMEGKNEHS